MFHIRWIIPVLLLLFLCIPVMAGPVLPAEYYGTVTINGNPAPVGTVITALINNQVVGSFTTTTSGTYGGAGMFDPRLVVQGTGTDQSIQFQINGRTAAQTSWFGSGTTQQFALSAQYSTGTIPAATTAAPTVSVTSTGTPGPDQTLVNPWTPVPTTVATTVFTTVPITISATVSSPAVTTAVTHQTTPRSTIGATQTVTNSLPPTYPPRTPTKKGTITAPTSAVPQITTQASPGLSFETIALLGIVIIAGVVLRK